MMQLQILWKIKTIIVFVIDVHFLSSILVKFKGFLVGIGNKNLAFVAVDVDVALLFFESWLNDKVDTGCFISLYITDDSVVILGDMDLRKCRIHQPSAKINFIECRIQKSTSTILREPSVHPIKKYRIQTDVIDDADVTVCYDFLTTCNKASNLTKEETITTWLG